MPIWLFVWLVVCGMVFLGVLIHLYLLSLCGCSFRDNIVFENKYERKIYFEKEKIKKIQKKCAYKIDNCEDKIKYYNSKSRYEKNVKLLHDKSLDNVVFISKDYFDYLQKCEKSRKRKVK